MKLITELNENVEYSTELNEATGKKHHHIHGRFLVAEEVNRNGRMYPLNVMQTAVDKYVDNHIKTNRGYGELGHPQGPHINLDRVSHLVVDLQRDGNTNYFIGKARLTDTPMGNIAKGLLDSGANLGVSSRGMGSLKSENGVMVVQPDYSLATAADIVADPSAPGAYVKGIMEGVEWFYDENNGWRAMEMVEEQKKFAKNNFKQIDEQKVIRMFQSFLKTL
jgi:hypothetical protein